MKFRNPLVDQTPRNPLRLGTRAARWGALACLVGFAVIAWPVGQGYLEGRRTAPDLAARADAVIEAGRGAEALGQGRFARLLAVQDPGFSAHSGIDLTTPGAGITTLTQSLAKRTGFESFEPGWAKLRQTGLALGYETGMTKDQIAALWLETVEMGDTPDGWATGFFAASERLYGRPPARLTEAEFTTLVARLIAPGHLSRPEGAADLDTRIARIRRLWAGTCAPDGPSDVWLEGCA